MSDNTSSQTRDLVPHIHTSNLSGQDGFFVDVLGLKRTYTDPGRLHAYAVGDGHRPLVVALTHDIVEPDIVPEYLVSVVDVAAAYKAAIAAGRTIRYPLTDEPWGVRRFFVEDVDGRVVNIVEGLR